MPNLKPVNVLGQEYDLTFQSVGLDRHTKGTIVLPDGMSLSEAHFWIETKLKEDEKVVTVQDNLYGFPYDGAHALQLAVEEMFGFKEMREKLEWFEKIPPAFVNIPTDATGNTVSVFIGRFSLPGYDGGHIDVYPHGSDSLVCKTECKAKCLPLFNKLMKAAKEKLRDHSLYRGKALEIETEVLSAYGNKFTIHRPSFIDVSKMPTNLILNEDTEALVRYGLWVPIERTEQVRAYNRGTVRRSACLHGAPGTGKTLTARQTAKIAQDNGWTFILVKDCTRLAEIYSLALRYAPVVLFAEDIDKIADDYERISILNNILDGVNTKTQDIITVLTTNYVDKLPQTLLRPGRFDVVARYAAPNAKTAAALLRMYLEGNINSEDFDDERIGEEIQGNVPAVLHEIAKRATTNAITRYPQDYRGSLKISTQDVMVASWTMKEHARLLRQEKPEPEDAVTKLGRGIGQGLRQQVDTGAVDLENAIDTVRELVE
jgi:hypothetical protein